MNRVWKLVTLASIGVGLLVGVQGTEWSSRVLRDSEAADATSGARELHRDWVEWLDRLATLQFRYRALHGSFAGTLAQLSQSAQVSAGNPKLRESVDVRIESNGSRAFRILSRAANGDAASVDQRFELRANFSVPSPSAEYLQQIALRQLRLISGSGLARGGEHSVFRGYFRYGLRVAEGAAFASGLKAPVVGMYLEQRLADRSAALAKAGVRAPIVPEVSGLISNSKFHSGLTGQNEEAGHAVLTAQAFQPIQKDLETVARSWSDLADIASFPGNGGESLVDVELQQSPAAAKEEAKAESARAPASELEIEPITSGN